MHSVTNGFKTLALANSRTWQLYAVVGATTILQADIIDFTLEDALTSDGYLVFGTAPSRKLNIKFNGTIGFADDTTQLKLFVGLNNEYIQLGTFTIDSKSTVYTGFTTAFVGYDAMSKYSDIPFENGNIDWSVATLASMYTYLQTKVDIDTAATPAMPTHDMPNEVFGTIRDLIMDIAELAGRYVFVHPVTGKISLPAFSISNVYDIAITGTDYFEFNLNSPEPIVIDTLQSSDLVAGAGTYGSVVLDNANMTQARLDALATATMPVSYYAYTAKVKGLPFVQVGDTVQITDVYSDTYNLIVGSHTLTYNGTMISTFTANCPDNSIVSMNRTNKIRTSAKEDAAQQQINSAIDEIANTVPSPIPTGSPLVKDLLTTNDKQYLMQMVAESYLRYTEYNTAGAPTNMFYLAAGSLKTAYDTAYTNIQGLVTTYPTITDTPNLTQYTTAEITDINTKVNAYVAAYRNLSSYLLSFFKNETGNTIIDNSGVHIGTYQDVPSVNSDGSYTDIGGMESLFTVTIATPAVITANGHALELGDTIFVVTSGTLPTGISNDTKYWVTPINSNTFKISTTEANMTAGTFVNTSGSQSGTHAFYAGGPNSRLTATALEFKYGNEKRVVIGSDNTLIKNAKMQGVSTIEDEVILPSKITIGTTMTITEAVGSILFNFK